MFKDFIARVPRINLYGFFACLTNLIWNTCVTVVHDSCMCAGCSVVLYPVLCGRAWTGELGQGEEMVMMVMTNSLPDLLPVARYCFACG